MSSNDGFKKIEKIESLKLDDDEFLFIRMSNDVHNASFQEFRKLLEKMFGPERHHRVCLYKGSELEFKKVYIKNLIDDILLGMEDNNVQQ